MKNQENLKFMGYLLPHLHLLSYLHHYYLFLPHLHYQKRILQDTSTEEDYWDEDPFFIGDAFDNLDDPIEQVVTEEIVDNGEEAEEILIDYTKLIKSYYRNFPE